MAKKLDAENMKAIPVRLTENERLETMGSRAMLVLVIILAVGLFFSLLYIVADKILLKLSQIGGFTIRVEVSDEE